MRGEREGRRGRRNREKSEERRKREKEERGKKKGRREREKEYIEISNRILPRVFLTESHTATAENRTARRLQNRERQDLATVQCNDK